MMRSFELLKFRAVPVRAGRAACALLLAACSVIAVGAQEIQKQGDQPYTLKSTARIVLLDIVVTDKKGNVVTNLKQGDFTIYENITPQRIRSFEPPSAHLMVKEADATPVVRSTADLTKIGAAPVTLLVLDELNTSFEDMAYSRNRIEKYLNAQGPVMAQPTTLLAANNTKFVVIKDFTQDRAAVLEALHKHFPEMPTKMMRSGAGSSGAFERMAQSLNSLNQMAEATRGTPGRKTIIWVGKGFPSVDLTKTDPSTTALLQNAIRRLTDTLLQSRITLYTIDPESHIGTVGTISTTDDLDDFENNSRNDGQPYADEINFSTLAPMTGGQAFFSRNDIDNVVATATADGANYYSISYTPTDPADDAAKYRHFRVKLSDPTMKATVRDGYYPATGGAGTDAPTAPKTPAELRAELEADMGKAAMSTIVYNGLNATLDKAPDNMLKLGVKAGDLKWADEDSGKTRAEITVMQIAFSSKGKVLGHFSQELSAEVMGQIKNPNQKAGFLIQAQAPAGTAKIRIVVRDALTGKIGTAELVM